MGAERKSWWPSLLWTLRRQIRPETTPWTGIFGSQQDGPSARKCPLGRNRASCASPEYSFPYKGFSLRSPPPYRYVRPKFFGLRAPAKVGKTPNHPFVIPSSVKKVSEAGPFSPAKCCPDLGLLRRTFLSLLRIFLMLLPGVVPTFLRLYGVFGSSVAESPESPGCFSPFFKST